jgi:hypothetical protein
LRPLKNGFAAREPFFGGYAKISIFHFFGDASG